MSSGMRAALALFVAGLLVEGCVARYLQPRNRAAAPPPTAAIRNSADLAKIGIEVYPGAELRVGQTVDQPANSSMVPQRQTPDDCGRVAKFYRDKYPAPLTMSQSGGQGSPGGLAMAISGFPQSRSVTVSEDLAGGGTQIMLQRFTGPDPKDPRRAGG